MWTTGIEIARNLRVCTILITAVYGIAAVIAGTNSELGNDAVDEREMKQRAHENAEDMHIE
jgi:hypothetical protein